MPRGQSGRPLVHTEGLELVARKRTTSHDHDVENVGEFTSNQVAELIGCTYRTLMRWAEQGLVDTPGYIGRQGVPVLWSAKNVREVAVVHQLRQRGLSLQRIRDVMSYLRSLGHNPFSRGRFVVITDGDGAPSDVVKVMDNGGEAFTLAKSERGQLLFPFDPPEDIVE